MTFLRFLVGFFRRIIEGYKYPDIDDVDPYSEDVE